jgi:hypothetical protein
MHSSCQRNGLRAIALLLTMLLVPAGAAAQAPAAEKKKAVSVTPPTVNEARAFLKGAEKRLRDGAAHRPTAHHNCSADSMTTVAAEWLPPIFEPRQGETCCAATQLT